MMPRWWWLPLALARHGPPPRPVADDASGRCPAPRNCSAPPEATGAVHVMASKAGWGGAGEASPDYGRHHASTRVVRAALEAARDELDDRERRREASDAPRAELVGPPK